VQLTLRVVRGPDATPNEMKRIEDGEFSIGRAPENDWILADPNRHLSKRHCLLSVRGGRWQVTDTSTNGTFVNRDIKPIGQGQTRGLRDGDRLRIGAYEIEIRVTEDETMHGSRSAWISRAGIDAPSQDPFGGDPFAELPGPPSVTPTAIPSAAIPLPVSRPVPPTRPVAPPPAVAPALDPAAFGAPAAVSPDTFVPPSAPPKGPDATLPQDLAPPTPAAAEARLPLDWDAVGPMQTVRHASEPAGSGAMLAAFLRGAGMPKAIPANPEATMEALGATFRALVSGLRATLMARASLKAEYRIEQTMMRMQGNNPLKFSADDTDALAALLGVGREIDMSPAEAVGGALRDVTLHEQATTIAIRAGLNAVIAQFDPVRFAALADPAPLAELPLPARARAWDLFVRHYNEIAARSNDPVDSVFARAFARSYEQTFRDAGVKDF